MTVARSTPLSFVVAVLAAVVLALLGARDTFAHARYESSFPGKGEVLDTSPDRVEITFSQEVQRVSGTYDIAVNKDRGPSVTAGPATVRDDDRRVITVPLQSDLQPGRYVVHWSNVSDEDGDPAEGAFSFYVQTPPNEIDLQNDQELETIGAEDGGTPTAPAGETPPVADTPAAGETAPSDESPAPAPTTAPADPDDDDDNDNSGLVIVVVTVVVVGVVAAAGAFLFVRSRGR